MFHQIIIKIPIKQPLLPESKGPPGCFNRGFALTLPLKATEFSAKAQQTATELLCQGAVYMTYRGSDVPGAAGEEVRTGRFFSNGIFSNGTGWARWASNVKWQSLVSYRRFVSQNIVVGNVCPQKGLSTNQFRVYFINNSTGLFFKFSFWLPATCFFLLQGSPTNNTTSSWCW